MFSKIKKYVIGFFVLLGGALIAFFSGKSAGRSKERTKDIDKKLDIVKKALKSKKKYKKDVQKILTDKKKELEKLKEFRLIFSAHGLPEKNIKKGDPYQWQVEQSVNKISEKLSARRNNFITSLSAILCFNVWFFY